MQRPRLIALCAMLAGLTPLAPVPQSDDPAFSDRIATIPFKLHHARVILPVQVGESAPLDVILDTGMALDGVVLFHREATATLEGVDFQEVLAPGAGGGEPARGLLADSISVRCGEARFPKRLVVVLESAATQSFPSDGVIGQTIFGHHVVELDYDMRVMHLYEPIHYDAPATRERIDVVLQNGIPFLNASVSVDGRQQREIRVYIDLASGDALELLVDDRSEFSVPDSLDEVYLGTGLSGDIHGAIGRVAWLKIGSFELEDVATSFPPAAVRSKQEGADGILGNDLLRRFNVVFDYSRSCIWVTPNQNFPDPFE